MRRGLRANAQHLPAFVIAAGRASRMRGDGSTALRALVQLRCLPAMRGLARAQAHLRNFSFGNSHKKGSRKAGISLKTSEQGSGFRIQAFSLVRLFPF